MGGGDDRHAAGPAEGDEAAQQGGELFLLRLGAEHGGEHGEFVDDGDDDGQAVGAVDLAAAVG